MGTISVIAQQFQQHNERQNRNILENKANDLLNRMQALSLDILKDTAAQAELRDTMRSAQVDDGPLWVMLAVEIIRTGYEVYELCRNKDRPLVRQYGNLAAQLAEVARESEAKGFEMVVYLQVLPFPKAPPRTDLSTQAHNAEVLRTFATTHFWKAACIPKGDDIAKAAVLFQSRDAAYQMANRLWPQFASALSFTDHGNFPAKAHFNAWKAGMQRSYMTLIAREWSLAAQCQARAITQAATRR
jgi:hypothetical protein